jgi:diketogulonate reductase-like aldo/keto reductase
VHSSTIMTLPNMKGSRGTASRCSNMNVLKAMFVMCVGLILVANNDLLTQSAVETLDTHAITATKNTSTSSREKVISVRSGASDTPSEATRIAMPAIGYGTCCRNTAKGDPLYKSTKIFLELGGRLIDTAMIYDNHKDIGKAIQDSSDIVSRSDLWITSKIAVTRIQGRENTVKAVQKILLELKTTYLDLCLIHSPGKGKKATIEIWKGLIDAVNAGLVKAIGVSNMNQYEILDLQEATGVLPAVNQIQYHPWTPKQWKDLVKWHTSNDIVTTAYTSLGGSRFTNAASKQIEYPSALTELAEKYHTTPTQVLLRWALNQQVAVIPGSSSKAHIQENLELLDFTLTMDERDRLEGVGPPTGWWDPKRGPVKMLDDQATQAWIGDHVVSDR